MEILTNIAVLLACYALGCVATAYYAVRWKTGRDLREEGSHSLGARNAGRILGPAGFAMIAVADIAKGAAAVLLARHFNLAGGWLGAASLAVIAGHLWPVQLGFRGGKGFATAYGVILATTPVVALLMWVVFFAGRLVVRRSTHAGLLAMLSAPLLVLVMPGGWLLQSGERPFTLLAMIALLVLWNHRANLSADFRARRTQQKAAAPLKPTDNP